MQNTEILITGGTGTLGRELSFIFEKRSIPVETCSRRNSFEKETWRYLDLNSGEGIEEAFRNKKIVFHLASDTKNPNKKTEVEGTKMLLSESKANNISHFIYISIVGLDKLPIPYYKYKRSAEIAVKNSGVPFTILRATQFHYFMDLILGKMLWPPIGVLPKRAKFQPIEAQSVAKALFSIGENAPLNRVTEIGGPEILKLEEIAKTWLDARKKKKLIVNLPLFGSFRKALSGGELTCKEEAPTSGKRWKEWLESKYGGRE